VVRETEFEPAGKSSKNPYRLMVKECGNFSCPHIRPQTIVTECPRLAQLVKSWDRLSEHLKSAV